MSLLCLAVSLLLQVATPTSKTAAEVALLRGDSALPIAATAAKPTSHTARMLFLVVSSDSLALAGERAKLRITEPAPGFQVTL